MKDPWSFFARAEIRCQLKFSELFLPELSPMVLAHMADTKAVLMLSWEVPSLGDPLTLTLP
eukprot:453101-Pelagomonas_calceolata.AAC.1